MRQRKLILLSLLIAACTSCTRTDPPPTPERVRVFASLPDWTGIWEAEPWTQRTAAGRPAGGIAEVRSRSVLTGDPPYKGEWEARYRAGLENIDAVRAAEATRKQCSFGFPLVMESPSLFQVAITPEETLFVFVTPDVRHVYTDGRPHPPAEELWPTRMGDSVGRWEGETLVIDTIARLPTEHIGMAAFLSKLSEQARFTERIRMVNPNELENEMTIEDPIAFARPWTVKLKYRRVTDLPRLGNYDCVQNDRNPIVDGQLTIVP
jgi:hypothetical protein